MPSKCITCNLKQPAFNLPDQKRVYIVLIVGKMV